MASSNLLCVCILHLGAHIAGDVKRFDNITWKKVKSCDDRRHFIYTTSKFFSVHLPDVYNDSIGYHSQCYKDFTAISTTPPCENIPSTSSSKPLLRSDSSNELGTTNSGVFMPKCIFCLTSRKQRKGKFESLGACLTDQAESTIREAAEALDDNQMIVRLAGIDLKSKEVKYHHSCRKYYLNKAESAQRRTVPQEQSNRTTAHINAFDKLKSHIEATLIEMPGAEFLMSLHDRYMDILGESGYAAQTLRAKILNEYPKQLTSCMLSKKQGTIIYNTSLNKETAMRRARFDDQSIKETAAYLRSHILSMVKDQDELPTPITVESVMKGQGETPAALVTFFRTLYTGSSDVSPNDRTERLVQSACDDVVFVTSRGRSKPSKHMCLGLGMKSLTGSRKVLETLNHFGHSISYHTAEAIETDLATNICDRNCATPEGIIKLAGLCTGIAWDNYDENTETLSGANTLHDTVGICYQNVPPDATVTINNDTSVLQNSQTGSSEKKVSKRSLVLRETSLQPYRKKPKITTFKYQVKHIPRPPRISDVEYKDMIWMMCLSLGETPMWAGWNALITDDPLPRQHISYMDNLNLPPTRLDVVAETLRISQRVASECDEQYAIVHYDLAVAKPAMQIQQTEAPEFDNVFICFGPFHIEMTYFAVLGYFIDGSGGPDILTETEVLAPGSLNGFLLGKHYNRCKRLHPLLATAFHILHFRQFLDERGPLTGALAAALQSAQCEPTQDLIHTIETHADFLSLIEAYEEYTEKTNSGQHGSTAHFWMTYIELVRLFLQFNRACRTNDVDLFIYALGRICPMFFACHRPNYARWMVKYLHNLMNMENTHPGIKTTLENGALSIRRSSKSFARNAVDITLEQTINADAASRSTGISAFSQSDSARRRWMVTRSVRSAIISHLMSSAGLTATEDVSKSLKPYRIAKDNGDLLKIMDYIQSTMNPFAQNIDQNLYCLTTGVKVDEQIKNDLLSCKKKGQAWLDDFVEGCFNDATRFEKPIKRRKVQNFASAAVKSKIMNKDLKLVELQGTRDLFGRLLYLSTLENIDLEKVFKYPLIPVPLSLAHIDGTLNKTDKAKLLHKLDSVVESVTPKKIDAVIIDAMFYLHTIINPPSSYGKIAAEILQKICDMAPRIDFVCENYKDPSIKDIERNRRGAMETTFTITGPDQKRPRDWQQALKSTSFNTALFRFLATEWQKVKYAEYLAGHQLLVALDETCYRYTTTDDDVLVEVVSDLECQHEEADTRMIFHLYSIACNPDKSISVRSNDTDVLVLLLYHLPHIRNIPNVWMDVGLSRNNSRRYINVNQIAGKLQDSLLSALPGFHAFTGSDTTAAFMNKGKLRPYDLVEKSEQYRSVFSHLGESIPAPNDVYLGLEKFVCAMYGKAHMNYVDDVRYAYFQQNYAPKKNDHPLEKIKGVNPSSMPPCQYVLRNKVLRANYVSHIWRNAHLKNPQSVQPQGQGWILTDEKYQVKWFDCDQVPQSICTVLGMDTSPRYLDTDEHDDEQNNQEQYSSDESDDSSDDWE